ncbi:CBS-domain-containing membrane protein [Nocardioides luteus]|uniref:CBS domain-containing protein n=1 Tax=Nocardioides luteus TaxID=1844 RepID=UPI002864C721|nr:CBS domain-containing protein [Nocardioides luteus]MDR7311294.1 CBS-domain-containing membrane protein [Nocardioides luteus]
MLVREIMTAAPVTAHKETPVKEALAMLRDHRITAMPVVTSAGRVCGVVAEIDLIRDRVLPDPRAHVLPSGRVDDRHPAYVVDVMSPVTVAVRHNAEVAVAVDIMAERALKSLPVLDEDNMLVGIVSRSDVASALARDDDAIDRELTALLAEFGHPEWLVVVAEGHVVISGPATAKEHALAEQAAATVAGVTRVRVIEAPAPRR